MIARVILALAVAAAMGAGIWGLAASRGADRPLPAAVGDTVSVPGGLVRVVRVQDVEYTMLPTSGPGMNMSTAHGGMPKIPKGYRRIAVEVLLYAEASPLEFGARDFRVNDVGPVGGSGRTVAPPGVAVSRSVEFQVPEAVKGLALVIRGAKRPILLQVAAAHRTQHRHDVD